MTDPRIPSPAETRDRLAATETTAQRIHIRNFVCAATIGVTPQERARPQRLGITLELHLVPTPPTNDEVDEVLNYGLIVRLLRYYCLASEYKLLETLCEALAAAFFSFERVLATRIRIDKIERYAEADGAGVEIERRRVGG